MSNNQEKIIKNFDFSSCRGDDVTWRATGPRICLVDNVAVTRVYALWHITMCARHVSQLLKWSRNEALHIYVCATTI